MVSLEVSELKIAGTLTLENMMFIEENKQVLAVMNHKGFQGIVATEEKANIGQRIPGPKGAYKVTSCPQEMNRRPLSALGPTINNTSHLPLVNQKVPCRKENQN